MKIELKIELIGIYDRGKLDLERVHFRTLQPIDLSFYAVFDSLLMEQGTKVQATNHDCYWFPPRPIPAGHNVVLYTRSGDYSQEKKPDGKEFHFLFRGLAKPLYASPESCAVIFELTTWATAK